jgi:hypothetical protein
LYNFFQYMQHQQHENARLKNSNILFWHTGGGLGLFDKCNDIENTMIQHSPCEKLDVYGNGNGIDISK